MADMDQNAILRCISGATIQYASTVSEKQPEDSLLGGALLEIRSLIRLTALRELLRRLRRLSVTG